MSHILYNNITNNTKKKSFNFIATNFLIFWTLKTEKFTAKYSHQKKIFFHLYKSEKEEKKNERNGENEKKYECYDGIK